MLKDRRRGPEIYQGDEIFSNVFSFFKQGELPPFHLTWVNAVMGEENIERSLNQLISFMGIYSL